MEIRTLPATQAAVRRFVTDLWLPYHRELERTVARHALADDVDLVEEEVRYRLELVREPKHRASVTVDAPDGGDAMVTDDDADLAGFVTTDVAGSPPVFDRPDQLAIGDLYVREGRRGTGLARALVETANDRAIAEGCEELTLDVDADNARVLAFYDRLGFEPYRHELARRVDGSVGRP